VEARLEAADHALSGVPATAARSWPTAWPRVAGRGWPKLPDGWPLRALYLAFPLWWLLGLSELIFVLIAVPMAVQLYRRRPLRLPRGFGLWMLFLLCVFAGIFVLQASAPGSIQTDGGIGRYLTFGYRVGVYLAITVVLLYVGNLSERELPARRVARLLGYMFVLVVIGGLVGSFLPRIEFTAPVEYLLPGGLRSNAFVQILVHPRTSEIQTVLGYAEARPVAPFRYANSWGACFSMFLPFFLLSWFGPGAGWRRPVAPIVLVAAAVPVVYSLNRGLWLALALGVAYVTVRLATMGKVLAVYGLVAGLVVAAFLFLFSPLSSLASERLDNPHSNDRRSQLSSLTISSVVQGSPIIGYGTTRNVQGSFFSIAGGETAQCRGCGVPPLGTQGSFFAVVFFQGLAGLALYLGFFLVRFFRHWRDRDPWSIAGCTVLVMFGLEMFVYDFNGAAYFTVMIAIALMWRMQQERDDAEKIA
jgi:hypothetical protein